MDDHMTGLEKRELEAIQAGREVSLCMVSFCSDKVEVIVHKL